MAANARARAFLITVAGVAVCLHAASVRSLAAEEKAGGTLAVEAEQIKEDLSIEEVPTRTALRFKKPVTDASVTVTIRPVSQGQRRN